MAITVDEIMNPELFTVRGHEVVGDVLSYFTALGVSAAPVVDAHMRPIGFVSWRELAITAPRKTILSIMSAPVDTIPATAAITVAAEQLCETNRHHLVCVDDEGVAIGFLGSLDVLRGLTGKPVPHPEAFPHWDPRTGLPWSNEMLLNEETVSASAPDGPGLFVLIRAVPGARNRLVWSGAEVNVRRRLLEFLRAPQATPPHLAELIEHGELWFRAASAPSARAVLGAVSHATS